MTINYLKPTMTLNKSNLSYITRYYIKLHDIISTAWPWYIKIALVLTKYTEYVLKNFYVINIFFNTHIFFSSIIFLVGSPSKRPIPDTTNWDLKMKREWLYKERQTFLDGVFLGTFVSENVIMLDEA